MKDYLDKYDIVWSGATEANWTFGRGSLLHPREEWRHRNFELFCENKKKRKLESWEKHPKNGTNNKRKKS